MNLLQTDASLTQDVTALINLKRIASIRLLIGLIQGFVLYGLYQSAQASAWPATELFLFSPLLLVVFIVPLLLISAVGVMSSKRLVLWALVASFILAALAFYDVWRNVDAPNEWFNLFFSQHSEGVTYPSALLWGLSCLGFFIAHALVLAASIDQRRIASYPTYFDGAWKLLIQIKFSFLFVCIMWAVLWLGAGLFMLMKMDFLENLLGKSWFAIPASVFAFSCALHLTDVRPAIVRGIRNLLLTLLSWLLPIAVLIVGGFLFSLPFKGFETLWATRHATSLLLVAAAVLVTLINMAFQNGDVSVQVARVLRYSARAACFMLVPLVVLAVYALALRVSAYGWTTDRIIAACCLLVASLYAFGYAWAAKPSGTWLAAIAPVNVGVAIAILLVLLALFSPVLDPARISVSNQVSRLQNAQTDAAKFDFAYLQLHGKRFGKAALEDLKANAVGNDAVLIKEKAASALVMKNGFERQPVQLESDVAKNLIVWPKGARLPESFIQQKWGNQQKNFPLPRCLRIQAEKCDAFIVDANGDGKLDVVILPSARHGLEPELFSLDNSGTWTSLGLFGFPATSKHLDCAQLRAQMQSQPLTFVERQVKDLKIGEQLLLLEPRRDYSSGCKR